MKKIFFITSGLLPNTKSIDFACYIANLHQGQLAGVFLEEDTLAPVPPIEPKRSYFEEVKESRTSHEVIMTIEQSMRYFVQECRKRGIQSEVYHHLGKPVAEAIHESRFADLLIIGSEEITTAQNNRTSTPFMKEVLSKAECPVIIAPSYFEAIDNIVFCYDGSRSSVFAMKQFTYSFPQYADKKVMLLEVEAQKTSLTKKANIEKWVRSYYTQLRFEVLEGNTDDELFKYFFMKANTFIVMGAYGRDILSGFFHHSAANTVMKSIDLPLFIAHH